MSAIDSYSEEDLRKALQRKRDKKKPKPVENPDFTDLIYQCEALVIHSIHERGWYDRGIQEQIFFQAMACIYGKDIGKYLSGKDW